jgi:hypothetical protein
MHNAMYRFLKTAAMHIYAGVMPARSPESGDPDQGPGTNPGAVIVPVNPP